MPTVWPQGESIDLGIFETMGDYAHRGMDKDQQVCIMHFFGSYKGTSRCLRTVGSGKPLLQPPSASASTPPSYKGIYSLMDQVAIGMGDTNKVLVHTTFSMSDLYAWKDRLGSYTAAPYKYSELVLSIICTHNPNWADLQAMLDVFQKRTPGHLTAISKKTPC